MKTRAIGLSSRFSVSQHIALLALSLVTLLSHSAHSAPIPGTSSSKLVSPGLGLFRSSAGFQISAGDSGWIHAEAPADNKQIATIYRAPDHAKEKNSSQLLNRVAIEATEKAESTRHEGAPSLTVRVDAMTREMSLEKYVQKWMKEYPKYGFDLVSAKPFSHNSERAFVLDLINRDNRKQIRQVVFLKKQKAVILTCRDGATTFKDSLKGCNQIIRTFTWTE